MKFILGIGGLLLVALVGCSSQDGGSNDNSTGGSGNTGGSGAKGGNGSTGGSGSTTQCGTATPTKVYAGAADDILRGIAVDDESVYVMENLGELIKIPKKGGSKTTVASTSRAVLDVMLRLYTDESKLYFSDDATLFAVDKSSGAFTTLAESKSDYATGIDPSLAFDGDYIYFGDKVADAAGTALGTVNRVKKSGGTPEVLASNQAGPSSLAFDDTRIYWVNEGTTTSQLKAGQTGGLGSVAKSGGSPTVLFAQASQDDISPSAGDLVVGANELYFASINLDNFSNTGEYKIAKAGGKPSDFSNCPAMLGAFIRGDQLYANCGDRISKFDLATGSETEIVCLPVSLEGSLLMTHDQTTIYYLKMEPEGSGDAIYSVPIE